MKILAPGFYARQNIRTPVKVALATLAVTQVANLALVPWLGHAGLAAAISVGATFNAAWLWRADAPPRPLAACPRLGCVPAQGRAWRST